MRVLTLSSGRVNALDVEVLEELAGSVRELQDSANGPLVITGAGRVFSAGVDLNRVVDGGSDYTDRLIPALSNAFDALFCFPWPTVAAINGAAIAGGYAKVGRARPIDFGSQLGLNIVVAIVDADGAWHRGDDLLHLMRQSIDGGRLGALDGDERVVAGPVVDPGVESGRPPPQLGIDRGGVRGVRDDQVLLRAGPVHDEVVDHPAVVRAHHRVAGASRLDGG